jgi:hypothetical protein
VRAAKFRAELIEGHKGVMAVIVPFDPEELWGLKPLRLAGRRHGWPVKGRAGRKRFVGYIGERWGRFFVTLDVGARPGELLSITLEPTRDAAVLAAAIEQSRATTQPKRARADIAHS